MTMRIPIYVFLVTALVRLAKMRTRQTALLVHPYSQKNFQARLIVSLTAQEAISRLLMRRFVQHVRHLAQIVKVIRSSVPLAMQTVNSQSSSKIDALQVAMTVTLLLTENVRSAMHPAATARVLLIPASLAMVLKIEDTFMLTLATVSVPPILLQTLQIHKIWSVSGVLRSLACFVTQSHLMYANCV